jgi:hypothetical protein
MPVFMDVHRRNQLSVVDVAVAVRRTKRGFDADGIHQVRNSK